MGNETQSPSVARRRLVFFLPEAGKQSGGGLTDGWTAAGCVGCFTPLPLRPPNPPPLWRSCRGTCEGRSAQISAGGPSRSFWLLAHDRLQEGRGWWWWCWWVGGLHSGCSGLKGLSGRPSHSITQVRACCSNKTRRNDSLTGLQGEMKPMLLKKIIRSYCRQVGWCYFYYFIFLLCFSNFRFYNMLQKCA